VLNIVTFSRLPSLSTTARGCSKNSGAAPLSSFARRPSNNILPIAPVSRRRRRSRRRSHYTLAPLSHALSVYPPKYTLCTPAICLSTHRHSAAANDEGGRLARERDVVACRDLLSSISSRSDSRYLACVQHSPCDRIVRRKSLSSGLSSFITMRQTRTTRTRARC